jgi:hypothetical protein
MTAPRRRPLGGLFFLLTAVFVGVAVYAGTAGQWVLTACAGALGLWMGELAFRFLR